MTYFPRWLGRAEFSQSREGKGGAVRGRGSLWALIGLAIEARGRKALGRGGKRKGPAGPKAWVL